MNVQDVLRRLADALNQAGIPYMLTGSLASSAHGMPRASNDFDLVIAPTPEQLRVLKTLLPEPQYYFDLGWTPRAYRELEADFSATRSPAACGFGRFVAPIANLQIALVDGFLAAGTTWSRRKETWVGRQDRWVRHGAILESRESISFQDQANH